MDSKTRKCNHCNNDFQETSTRGTEQKYCSVKCRTNAGNKRHQEKIINKVKMEYAKKINNENFGTSIKNNGQPIVSSRFILVTFLIYSLVYEGLVLGGCGYVVFGLGYSGWWFVLAVLLSGCQFKPLDWHCLMTGKPKPKEAE